MTLALKHFYTITKHRHTVIKHCFKAGIPLRGFLHDLSKYSFTEFISGSKYYQGNRSPNDKERELFGYSSAWLHHKGRNKHHFEYWTDYNRQTHTIMPVKMPTVFVIEMFCDRVAASKIYAKNDYDDSHPIQFFLRTKKTRFIHKETSDALEYLLTMLQLKGEENTFNYIKKINKNKAYDFTQNGKGFDLKNEI